MELVLLTSDHFKTLNWTGGTTKELFIFPANANYQERNFLFRLSTATVETETSDFTLLPGVSRKLMILSGSIHIKHEGHYSKQLNKFDIDSFEGGWKTSSIGKCTDFNLMTSGNTAGEIYSMIVKKERKNDHPIKENCNWFFIYVSSGKITTEIHQQTNTLNTGDLLVIQQPPLLNLTIRGMEDCELVIIEIT